MDTRELHAHHQLIHALVAEVRNLREQLRNLEATGDWQAWYSSSDAATAAYRPKLVVEYTLPGSGIGSAARGTGAVPT